MAINALFDPGIADPRLFLETWLNSREFADRTLRSIYNYPGQPKAERARVISAQYFNRVFSADSLLLKYARQPKKWLSLRLSVGANRRTQLGNTSVLPRQFGHDGWYGPIVDPRRGASYYFHVKKLPTTIQEDDTVIDGNVRWILIAEVTSIYMAIKWDNFRGNDGEGDPTLRSHDYWNYVSEAFASLGKELGATLTEIDLYDLVFSNLWRNYLEPKRYKWEHRHVRAERAGVALHARSHGVQDLSVKGLESLAEALAKSAASSIGIVNDAIQTRRIQNALTRTLIREWGTKSYEFKIDDTEDTYKTLADGSKELQSKRVFRAHCYFGNGGEGSGPDTLQHLKCYNAYGDTTGTLDFLLKALTS